MQVLIPCAGAGSRFEKVGYSFPKPLIAVKNFNDKPMIQVVVENLNIPATHTFIVRKEHTQQYHFKQLLNRIAKCNIVEVDHLTEGAACTTLLAKEFINNDEPLLIANSDQYIENFDWNEFMHSMQGDKIDGGILTFENSHPKWSYVRQDDNGFVTEVKEKEVVSNEATVGIYYWQRGRDYVKYAEQMIAKGKSTQVNNEWYCAPVFNEAIQDGKKVKIFHIEKMHGLGTPEDLEYFYQNYHTK